MNSANLIAVMAVIAFFGLLAAVAIGFFIYSILDQRRYNSTTLPDILGDKKKAEEAAIAEKERAENFEIIEENRFSLEEDDPLVFNDEESNELFRGIEKAGIRKQKGSSLNRMQNLFKKEKDQEKGNNNGSAQ